MKGRMGLLAMVGAAVLTASAWAAEPVAYVSEIRRAGGDVRIRPAGAPASVVAEPLAPLYPGDDVEVTGDARVVLLFHAGAVAETVAPANSPFRVPAVPAASATERFRAVGTTLTQFFVGKQGPPTYRKLAARGPAKAETDLPMIIAPRETRMLPGPLEFEWDGSEGMPYRLSGWGPAGLVWERDGLSRQRVRYPETARPLEPGLLYTWRVEAPGYPTEPVRFEIVPEAEAVGMRSRLALLGGADAARYPRNTVVLMRVAVLAGDGLHDAARRELEAAISADPGEPVLHTLLGHVYERMRLSVRAARAFERARALSRIRS
jgi:hypothetical protein